MERKAIKARARASVQSNLIMAIGLFFIPVAIQMVVAMIFDRGGDSASVLATILNFILTTFISVGYAKAYLRLNRQQTGNLEDLLAGVTIWERSIQYGLWYWLFSIAWSILPVLIFTFSLGILGYVTFTGGNWTLFTVTMIMSSLALGLVSLFIQIRYGFAVYLLLEEPTLNPKACFTKSKTMVRGHYGELLRFYFSFFWWFVLTAVTFGLAAFFVIPYIMTAYAGVYDAFCQQGEQKAPISESVPQPTPVA
ncbi:MAG: DUF975 family protein [Culicoidibacterales bacterium]